MGGEKGGMVGGENKWIGGGKKKVDLWVGSERKREFGKRLEMGE